MVFNKKIQYGLLLTIYLVRAGRANAETAAQNLNISLFFLNQVARKLRIASVIKSVKGPGGGYELVGEPKVKDVFKALGGYSVMKQKDKDTLLLGNTEKRVLGLFVTTVQKELISISELTIRSLVTQSVTKEMGKLDSLDLKTERAS